MKDISTSRIAQELKPYGIEASEVLCQKIQRYICLLLRWNERIALTTVTDPIEIVRFHFGESIFALTSGMVKKCRLADVGTGAGFPGLALALAEPGFDLTLIESNIKKSVFLREAARELASEQLVKVSQTRMEDFAGGVTNGKFDCVTARAVGHFGQIVSFGRKHLSTGGRLVLWVGADDAAAISREYEEGWAWSNPKQILGSDRRYLISGEIR
jgi:16S rRNA (guanine527-N7)-methyltransferase